jgi:hypothetical protein
VQGLNSLDTIVADHLGARKDCGNASLAVLQPCGC